MIAQSTSFLLGTIFGLGGTAVAIASRYLPRPRATPAAPPASTPAPDGWLPCHGPSCGHLSTPSDRTPTGLACGYCGTPRSDRS